MKMRVLMLVFCVFPFSRAVPNDQSQLEKYSNKMKTYQLDVPGKEPITIIESEENGKKSREKWEEISSDKAKDNMELKNIMTDIIHDTDGSHPRCYGPSCQEGFDDSIGPQEDIDFYSEHLEKMKDYPEFSKDRLLAISALAEKLKKDKYKSGNHYAMESDSYDDDDDSKVYSTWNRLNVKQHKHPYDEKEGWVSLEPIAWSTSKISKWKPNLQKKKPYIWNKDKDSISDDENGQYNGDSQYNYHQKRPAVFKPAFINNKLHVSSEYEPELPSKPTWDKPHLNVPSHLSSWSEDDSRRPHKHNCDSGDSYQNDETVIYSISDSVVTDPRPANFPYEYEALHQPPLQKRPTKRPTQVVYAGYSAGDRSSGPPNGDGQWVLLSTTKGYKNKKRQRSLNSFDKSETVTNPSIISHKAVALTVLPINSVRTNMTTSHGGLLEVEQSFQTVEESKLDMDKKNDLEETYPTANKILRRKLVSNRIPDSSSVLAAVGAGMVPATMAMVVPMMLGRRRRRRDISEDTNINYVFLR